MPKDDPAFKKALVFVSRCQNLKSEHNDQPWAGKINDGSFIYTAAAAARPRYRRARPDDGLPGYGSMTYAGIKSLIYCGVEQGRPADEEGAEWIQQELHARRQPRHAGGARASGACTTTTTRWPSAWTRWARTTFTDAKGVKHDWRAD